MNVLIHRLGPGLGDIVRCFPALQAARRRWPDAHITFMTEARYVPLLDGNPNVDAVISPPHGRLGRRQKRMLINSAEYDAVVNLFGPAARYERATGNEPTLSRTEVFCNQIGAEPTSYLPWYRVTDDEKSWALEWTIAHAHSSGGRPLIGIQEASADPLRSWPHTRVLERMLRQHAQCDTVVFGPKMDTTCRQICALVERCQVLVAPDSGLLHVAAMVGTPCVGLFGPTDPNTVTKHYPKMRTVVGAPTGRSCRQPCWGVADRGVQCSPGEATCLVGVSPESVLSEVTALLMAETLQTWTPQSRRVLFVLNSEMIGGAERIVHQQCAALRDLGWNTYVATLQTLGRESFAWKDVVTGVNFGPPGRQFRIAGRAEALLAYARKVRAGLIVTANTPAEVFSALVKRAPVPVVDVIHSRYAWNLMRKPVQEIHQAQVAAIAPIVADRIKETSGIVAPVIENGVDLDRYMPASKPTVRIGWLGRVAPDKDLETWVRAAGLIRRAWGDSVSFLWIGGIQERFEKYASALERLMAEEDVEITLTGYTQNPERYLRTLDVFLFTSQNEGAPIAIQEAMACGLAVVSTNVEGIPGLVTDQVDGLLVPPNDPEAAADAVLGLLNRWTVGLIGQKARETAVKRFDQERMVREWDGLYRATVDGQTVPSSNTNTTGRPTRIILEDNQHVRVKPWRDGIRAGAEALGLSVRSSKFMPGEPWCWDAIDAIVCWNGTGPYKPAILQAARAAGVDVLVSEHGWLPQIGTYWFDPQGVNAASSLASYLPDADDDEAVARGERFAQAYRQTRPRTPGPECSRDRIFGLTPRGYVFVPLQCEYDSQIDLYSPIKTMLDLLEQVRAATPKHLMVVAKPHPRGRIDPVALRGPGVVVTPAGADLYALIEHAAAVITINSTVGIEAFCWDAPVLTIGDAFYGGKGRGLTVQAGKLANLDCCVKAVLAETGGYERRARMALLAHLAMRQWTYDDLKDPERLAALLDRQNPNRLITREATTSGELVHADVQ